MLNRTFFNNDIDHQLISEILLSFHNEGPVNYNHLETLAYYKKFAPERFKQYESRLMYVMGLFYKADKPKNFFEKIYEIYAESIKIETNRSFTPIQADAYNSIKKYNNFSFSAPTSAGKSFLYQEIIKETNGDIIIVVPSRALLSEYIIKIKLIAPKTTLVLPFIELVNLKKTNKRIFIITPERGDDLFKFRQQLNIELILFDEAQLSEEGIRGMKFDSFVRRVDSEFKNVKKVFTHPFITNPEAQLKKHKLKKSNSEVYKQKTVGKIFLEHQLRNFKYFSPFQDESNENISYSGDIIIDTLINNKTALIYISKDKIYNGSFLEIYSKYLKHCEEITDIKALSYIEELRKYIGANNEKKSLMLMLMQKGVVIHHGSMPLKARLIIEKFVNENFAKLCFSTSTLIQGINMPFDVVWINNFRFTGESEDQKRLNLKNLIGRAGRTTSIKNHFDYGYVIIEKKNKSLFIERINKDSQISNESLLDKPIDQIDEDFQDVVNAIKNDDFNTTLNLTNSQVERIITSNLDNDILYILDNLLDKYNTPLTGNSYYELGEFKRKKIKKAFQTIYKSHLKRNNLSRGEMYILSTAIPILLWQIQGKSFAEIVSLRYSFLSKRDYRRKLRRQLRNNEITLREYHNSLKAEKIRFSCIADSIPNKRLTTPQPLFKNTSIRDIDFDKIIYDTYDYIDKVISLSLKDSLSAAFELYHNKTNDQRAKDFSNYIKYGTNEENEIWLLKYGFTFDEIEWLLPHIKKIDADEIKFKSSIRKILIEKQKKELIERYL